MTELRAWTGRQTAGHSTMPQSAAISRAEAHAQALHSTMHTQHTTVLGVRIMKCTFPYKKIVPAVSKHMVVNEHAGLCIHTKTCGLFWHYTK